MNQAMTDRPAEELAVVQAELRAVSGSPGDEVELRRRQALWRQLDQLLKLKKLEQQPDA